MLDGRKAFGEKVAREMEQTLGLPRHSFDSDDANEVRESPGAIPALSPAAVDFGRTWDELQPELQAAVATLIRALVKS